MNLIKLNCPECGAKLEINEKLTHVTCNYCGSAFYVNDAYKTGYENEKGHIQAQREYQENERQKQIDGVLDFGRVESLDDKAFNHTLFELFGKLVMPVRFYENTCYQIQSATNEINKKKKKIKPNIGWLKTFVIILVIVNVVLLFGEIFCTPNIHEIYMNDKGKIVISDDYTGNYEHSIFRLIYPKKYVYKRNVYLTPPPYSEIDTLPKLLIASWILHFWLSFQRSILVFIIIWVINWYKYKKAKPIYDKNMQELNSNLRKTEEEIKDLIKYVPPKYRNSDALSFFYDAYKNSKVDNLKEAVRLYDEQNRHIQVMAGLQAIERAAVQSNSELNFINSKLGTISNTLTDMANPF